MIVIDASLVVDLVTAKKRAVEISKLLEVQSQDVFAPELLDIEVLHALRKLQNLKQMSEADCSTSIALYEKMPIKRMTHASLLTRIWELGFNMSPYDAAYIALAENLGAELWTSDPKFSRTPGHSVSVRVFLPAP